MHRLRTKIPQAKTVERISRTAKLRCVPDEGGGITGDVDDCTRPPLDEHVDDAARRDSCGGGRARRG